MSNANWKITLEVVTDDGDGPRATTIGHTGAWEYEDGCRFPEASIASDMGAIIRMLHQGGFIVRGKIEDAVTAFSDMAVE